MGEKLKILYVATISNTINAFLIPHIKYLIELGHEVDVACNVVSELSLDLILLGCRIHNIGFQRAPLKKENYIAYKLVKKLVLDEGYQLIHTHTPIASIITRFACRNISNLKVLYTVHGFHFFKGAPIKNWIIYYPIEKLALKWTDGLITINNEDYGAANKMKLRKMNSVFKVNGVGVDLLKFFIPTIEKKGELRSKYDYSINDLILLYTAELNHNKHQNLIIDAVSLLRDRIPNIKLLLVGDGLLKEQYEEQVTRLALKENVEFLGYRNDVADILKLADVAVSASRREGLPVNVIEAMATGLPLIVTDCRGNRDLVRNGESGYVVGIDDIVGFADAIEKLYKSKELRQKFGEKGLEFVCSYSLDNVKREMEAVYRHYINI